MKRALVLGGGGQLGTAIVHALLDDGWHVRALVRRPKPFTLLGLDVEVVVSDLDTSEYLDTWLNGCEVVVDCAVPYPLAPGRANLRSLDQRLEPLLAACETHGAIYAQLSSFATARAGAWVHPYFAVKQRAEERVRQAAERGLETLILRPTTCLGPWDNKPWRLALLPQLMLGLLPVPTREVVDVVDVRDVAASLLVALKEKSWGHPQLLSGRRLRLTDLVTRATQLADLPAPATVPSWLATGVTSGLELSLRQHTPWPSLALLLIRLQASLDRSPPLVHPRPLDETLRSTIESYRRRGFL
ncbi:MAG: NAD(P)H-binding protein [Acidobacteriota bacterium]